MFIILAVILVIRRGHKHRAQVEHFHLQALQIVEFVPDSLDIAAVKPVHIKDGKLLIPFFHLRHRKSDVDIFVSQDIVRRIPVIKPVHEDLVHQGAFRPLRYMESRCDHKRSVHPSRLRHTEAVIVTDFVSFYNLKIIYQRGLPQLDRSLIKIKSSGRLRLLKLQPPALIPVSAITDHRVYMVHVPGPGPESYLNILPALRLFRDAVLSRSIAEKCRLQHFEWPPCWSDAASLAISGLHFLYLFSLISHKCYYTGLYPHLHVFSESSLRRSSKTVFAD